MLSDKEILRLIEEYSKTPTGKKEIEKRCPGKFVAQYATGKSGARTTVDEMKKLGEEMADILHRHIITDTKTAHGEGLQSFSRSSIIVGEPKLVPTDKGKYLLEISFDEAALRRESLNPDKYDGVENIIKLFVTGYHAGGVVRGKWRGHGDEIISSLPDRESNDFLNNAVREFNSSHGGNAMAIIREEYKNNRL